MLHENFEWDEQKARKNLRKHGVSFDDAALVLADEEGTNTTSTSTIVRTARTKIVT
jgi:uncharacterized DUF497 family protein